MKRPSKWQSLAAKRDTVWDFAHDFEEDSRQPRPVRSQILVTRNPWQIIGLDQRGIPFYQSEEMAFWRERGEIGQRQWPLSTAEQRRDQEAMMLSYFGPFLPEVVTEVRSLIADQVRGAVRPEIVLSNPLLRTVLQTVEDADLCEVELDAGRRIIQRWTVWKRDIAIHSWSYDPLVFWE